MSVSLTSDRNGMESIADLYWKGREDRRILGRAGGFR